MQKTQIQVKKLHPDSKVPKYMTELAAGMDICAFFDADMTIEPGQRCLIPTGLAFAIPAGYEAQVRPRCDWQ